MKGFFLFIWSSIVISSVVITGLSLLASYIPPQYFWGLCFLNYALPFLFAFNVILIIVCIFVKEKIWWLVVGLLIGLFGLSNNISWKSSLKDQTSNYTLLSYNVRLFDFYNWMEGNSWDDWKERTDNGAILKSIYELLESQNTDFICFQEYFNQKKGDYTTEKTLKNKGYLYRHIAYSFENGGDKFGIATFSKFPIINKSDKFFGNNNGVLISDVVNGKDTIRIFNLHLQSFKFGKKDYQHLNTLSDTTLTNIWTKPTKSMLKRIKIAFDKRSEQISYVAEIIDSSIYPIVLCGDFNELPHSYLYGKISRRLNDSFKEVGSGLGKTLVSGIPGLRIDYVFHSPELKAIQQEVIQQELSDHYPVLFHFKKVEKVEP